MSTGYVESPHVAPEYQINLRGLVLGLQQERPAEESEVVFALLPRPSSPWKFPEEGELHIPVAIEQIRFRRWPYVRLVKNLLKPYQLPSSQWAFELREHPPGFNPEALREIGFTEVPDGRWFGIPTTKVLDAREHVDAALQELLNARIALNNAQVIAAPTFTIDELPKR